VAHSIELLFDHDTDAALRSIWDALDAAGVPSQNRVTSPTNRPHVTMTVADHIDAAVDAELTALADLLPLPCIVGAPLVFGTRPKLTNGPESASDSPHFVGLGAVRRPPRFTLAHLILPSAQLLDLHRRIHQICTPHMTPGPAPHSAPGNWTAHATLGRRVSAADLGVAFAAVLDLTGERQASFTALRRWDGDARVEHVLLG
jgi:hypothetical protein